MVFDVDGVLIDVSESYDLATKLTAEHFLRRKGIPVEVNLKLVRELRRKGSFGDDFKVSEALIAGAISGDLEEFVESFPLGEGIAWVRKRFGAHADPEEVERHFNSLYLRELWRREKPLVDTDLLRKVMRRFKTGVITGRCREEVRLAEEILGIRFERFVCREMARKPDPKALEILLGEDQDIGFYVGDTVNDEPLVLNYVRRMGRPFGFLMVGRDVEDVNEVLEIFSSDD